VAHLESFCEGRVSLGHLGGGHFIEGGRFWLVSIPQVCTWSGRKMLKLRVESRHFIKFFVGDGSQIHFWFDDWHLNWVLHAKYGPRVIYDAQRKLDAQLSTIIKDGQWMWRLARSDMPIEIQSQMSLVPLGGKDTPQYFKI